MIISFHIQAIMSTGIQEYINFMPKFRIILYYHPISIPKNICFKVYFNLLASFGIPKIADSFNKVTIFGFKILCQEKH